MNPCGGIQAVWEYAMHKPCPGLVPRCMTYSSPDLGPRTSDPGHRAPDPALKLVRCDTETRGLLATEERADLPEDLIGVGESLPSEAADLPALRFE